jgi:oxygen-independent coproporphyrinogen III oxidase
VTPELIARYGARVPRYTSYPTAPHFSPVVDDAVFARWVGGLVPDTRASAYLHVPFCASLCWYCGCNTTVVQRHQPVAEYVRLIEQEIALVGKVAPTLELASVHWGGGTPNMLTGSELRRLMTALAAHFQLADDVETAAELDPRILDRDKVAALAAIGLNRASLGVQDFDPRVQRAINRVQPYAMTRDAVTWLRDAGISGINFDLMYGLPFQTVDGMLTTIDQAVCLKPDRVALFGYAHVPWMKKHQLLLPEGALPSPAERLAQSEAAADRLVKHGYCRIGLDHFAHPEDSMALQHAKGSLKRNFQGYTTDPSETILGFGVSAISTLPSGYAQNASDLPAYRTRIEAGRAATVRGIAISPEDKLRRAAIEALMCMLEVDLDDIACRHGFSPEVFGGDSLGALADLERDGIVRRIGSLLQVTPQGRPLVRAVCAAFDAYLPDGAKRHSIAV